MIATDKRSVRSEQLGSIYGELAALLGVEAALKLHDRYRGTQLSFPMELFSREYIAAQILQDYNGHNVKKLAVKYGYTEKWIRKILKDHTQNQKE